MNKVIRIFICLIIIINLIYISSFINCTYAAGTSTSTSTSTSSSDSDFPKPELDITSDNFQDQFNPANVGGEGFSEPVLNVMIPVIKKILTIIQILGAIILVLSLALAGINGILASEDGLAEDLGLSLGKNYNQWGIGVDGVKKLNKSALSKIIRRGSLGSAILFFSSTIVKIVFRMVFYI